MKQWKPSWQPVFSVADLIREGILTGVSNDEIRSAQKEKSPDYKSIEEGLKKYPKELLAKGLINKDRTLTLDGHGVRGERLVRDMKPTGATGFHFSLSAGAPLSRSTSTRLQHADIL